MTTDKTWGLSPSGLALCDCIQATDNARQSQGARKLLELLGDSAFETANDNDVDCMVGHALGEQAGAEWKDAHASIESRMNRLMAELDSVAELLHAHGIPVVALKNAGIARGLFDCLGCCPMGDLDLMVRKSDFREAHQLLVDDGYEFEFRSEFEENDLEEAERGGGSEYFKMLPDGSKLWLELQWRPVAGRWIRPDQEPDSTELMGRSVEIPGSHVRLLSPQDNLLQVALHTAKHTYVRAPGLRLHTDVDRILLRQEIDWREFVDRTRKLRLCTAVYFSLLIPSHVLGTQVPDWVLAELRPSRWKVAVLSSWIRQAGLTEPNRRKFTRLRYIAFNSLLYDDLSGFLKGLFPSPEWVLERYGSRNRLVLPILYARRLWELLFRRANT